MLTFRGLSVAAAALMCAVAGVSLETALASAPWQEPWPNELKLSNVQRVSLDSLRDVMANQIFKIRIDIKRAQLQLQNSGAGHQPQASHIQSQKQSLRLLKTDLKLSALKFQESIHRILSPLQWQRWTYYQQDLRVDRAGRNGKLVSFSEGQGRTASTRHLSIR